MTFSKSSFTKVVDFVNVITGGLAADVSDSITISELIQMTIKQLFLLRDDFSAVSDSVNVILQQLIAAESDSLNVSEDCTVVLNQLNSLKQDSVKISEFFNVLVSAVPETDIDIQDSAALSDYVSVVIRLEAVCSSLVGVSESVALLLKQLHLIGYDSVTAGERVDVGIGRTFINVFETLILGDYASGQSIISALFKLRLLGSCENIKLTPTSQSAIELDLSTFDSEVVE